MSKHFYFAPKATVPEILWFLQMHLCSLSHALMLSSERRGFLLTSKSNDLLRVFPNYSTVIKKNNGYFQLLPEHQRICLSKPAAFHLLSECVNHYIHDL